jgi:hypothetical protein
MSSCIFMNQIPHVFTIFENIYVYIHTRIYNIYIIII